MPQKYWIKMALFLAGFNSLAAQILFLREFFILFQGGELALGFLLACWLGWTALGSMVGGKILSKRGTSRTWRAFHHAQVILIPFTLLLISSNRIILQVLPGETLSIEKTMTFALLETSAFCVVSGMLFSIGSYLYANEIKIERSTASSHVYFYETLGAGFAGIFITLLLIIAVNDILIAIAISGLNLIFLFFFGRINNRQFQQYLQIVLYLILFIFLTLFPVFRTWLVETGWQPLHIETHTNSKFGEWVVIKVDNDYTFYLNGMVMFSLPDQARAEENVHYALLQHPEPKNILMIGGGLNGGLSEALKHPTIQSITYLDLDPESILLMEQLNLSLPDDACIEYRFKDVRRYLQSSNQLYDIILCNSPDPVNAQLNRFYTKEFFYIANAHLNKNGLIAIQAEGSENFISHDHSRYLTSLYTTLESVFKYVDFIPGENIHFFASVQPGVVTPNADSLVQRLQQRDIQTSFVREYYIPYRLMPDRIEFTRQALTAEDQSSINSDLFPQTYYLNAVFQGSKFLSPITSVIKYVSKSITYFILGAFIVLIILLSTLNRPLNKSAGLLSVFNAGLTIMAFEVALLISFQSLYGFVYFEIAMLTGTLMLGMAAGTLTVLTINPKKNYLQLFISLILLILTLILFYFMLMSPFIQTWLLANQHSGVLLFFFLSFLCGSVGGVIFPSATSIYYQIRDESKMNIGIIYTADLGGALLGSMLPTALLFPLIGIANTVLFLIILNFTVFLILFFRRIITDRD